MSFKYGITCETCGHLSRWLNAPPTVCPNDNSHVVNHDSVNIEEMARATTPGATILRCDYRDFYPVYSYVTQGTYFFITAKSLPIYVKIVASVESGTYQFRMRDSISGLVYYTSPELSNTTPQFYTMTISDISNPPMGETCVDVEIRSSESVVTVRGCVSYVTQL